MPDPIYVLVALMVLAAIYGFGVQAGINKARRDARRWYK
jgi:hypothetical protein